MKTLSAVLVTGLLLVGCQGAQQASAPITPAATPEAPKSTVEAAASPPPAPTTWVGPFGVQMGLTKQQIVGATGAQEVPENRFSYMASKAPKSHVDFQTYEYTIGDQAGLCSVSGIGNDFDADSYGNAVRGNFATIEDALTKKYGEPTRTDKSLAEGSIWNEPKDWMMGLNKKERSYRVDWKASADHPLPDHLALIRLMAVATRFDHGALAILYRFDNNDACDKEIAASRDSSL
jgi:hypothetical protein